MHRRNIAAFFWGRNRDMQVRLCRVHVQPLTRPAHETADFMQAAGAPVNLATRDKFNNGMVGILPFMAFHFQADPFGRRCTGQAQHGGTGGRMPCRQQIVFAQQGIGGVARTHQRCGIGRRHPILQVRGATIPELFAAAARASPGQFCHNGGSSIRATCSRSSRMRSCQ